MIVNTAVLVSGGGTNLQALIDAQSNNKLGPAKITLVLSSNFSAYALQRAEKSGVKTEVVDRKSCANLEEFNSKILDVLKENDIHMVILAGFMNVLGKNVVDAYDGCMINIHPSLIPDFCGTGFYGIKVHEAALAAKVKVSGATVHYVNSIPDGGDIILQKAVMIQPDDTPELLQKRIMEEAEWEILPRAAFIVAKKIEAGLLKGKL